MIVFMEIIWVYVALALFGAAFGSFAGATVWRLRAKQLQEDKAAGEKVDKKEYARLEPLIKQGFWQGRSICLDTGKTLPWYDLIPVVSWLMLRGKSRFSGKPIGKFEFIIEVAMLVFFVVSFAFWPAPLEAWQDIAVFILWLASGVGLCILFAYDVRWFLLPDRVMYPLLALGVLIAGLRVSQSADVGGAVLDVMGAVLILGGLYFVLHIISGGRWVGFGDVKLGLFMGLALGVWPVALVALFLSNLIGCLYVLPAMFSGKVARNTRVPFGPFLILGFVLAGLFGQYIVDWYINLTFSSVIAVVL